MNTGYCTHREKIVIRSGGWKTIRIPALCVLIEHPTAGPILFDTGYSRHFEEACTPFPYSLYRRVTPVFLREGESAAEQLSEKGIPPQKVKHVLLSHFHGDHIAGCRDFPQATFHCFRRAYEAVGDKRGITAVRQGFVPKLLPDDFRKRARFLDDLPAALLPEPISLLGRGYDVFGDGSLFAVDLSGHAIGQFGLFFYDERNRPILLCADAVWSSRAYREESRPHWLAYLLFPDRTAYQQSFAALCRLHREQPELVIIPSHCSEMAQQWGAEGRNL